MRTHTYPEHQLLTTGANDGIEKKKGYRCTRECFCQSRDYNHTESLSHEQTELKNMKNVTWDNRKVLWNSNTDPFRVTYCTVQSHITVSLIWPNIHSKGHWEVLSLVGSWKCTVMFQKNTRQSVSHMALSRVESAFLLGWGLRRTLCCVHRAHCSLEKLVSGVSAWRRVCVNYVLREKASFSDWRTRFQKCVFTNRERVFRRH